MVSAAPKLLVGGRLLTGGLEAAQQIHGHDLPGSEARKTTEDAATGSCDEQRWHHHAADWNRELVRLMMDAGKRTLAC